MSEEVDVAAIEKVKHDVLDFLELLVVLDHGDTVDIYIEKSDIAGWITKFDATVGVLGKQ